MPRIKLPFLVFDRDRHGNTRVYVRVPGRNKVRIRAPIGSPEFMAEYNRAIAEDATAPRGPREGKPGSFRNLCVRTIPAPIQAPRPRRRRGVVTTST